MKLAWSTLVLLTVSSVTIIMTTVSAASQLTPPIQPLLSISTESPTTSDAGTISTLDALQAPQIQVGVAGDKFDFRASVGTGIVEIGKGGGDQPGIKATLAEGTISYYLRGYPEANILSHTASEVVYRLNNNAKLKYTLSHDRVKEDIILLAPPEKPYFECDYKDERVERKATKAGGVSFEGDNASEPVELMAPVMYDSKGSSGKVEMDIKGGLLRLTLDAAFLKAATYPVTIDPTLVAGTGGQNATRFGTQHRIVVLSDGTLVTVFTGPPMSIVDCGTAESKSDCGETIYWASSTDDGSTWTSQPTGSYGGGATIETDGSDNLYLAYMTMLNASKPDDHGIFFRNGTFSPGPSYSWSSRKSIGTGRISHDPSIEIDNAGRIHILIDSHSHLGRKSTKVLWNYSADGGASWCGSPIDITLNEYTTTTTAGSLPSLGIDANDDLYATWNDGNGVFQVRRRAAGSWACTTANWGASPWASFGAIGSPADHSAKNAMMLHAKSIKVGGGEIALVLPADRSTTGTDYTLATSPTGAVASWTMTPGVNGSVAGDGWPALAEDRGEYYTFLKDTVGGSSNISYYRYAGGTLDTKQVLDSDPSASNNYPNVAHHSHNGRLHLIWTNGDVSPYSVKYGYLELPPNLPTGLIQYRSDHSTILSTGGVVTDDGTTKNLFLDMMMSSLSETSDTLTPQIEILPIGQAFTGVATYTGSPVVYSDSPVTGSVAVTGLSADVDYHWQGWVSNSGGSGYPLSYGSNPEISPDVSTLSYMIFSIDSTYNLDGSPGGGGVLFGSAPPNLSPFLIHSDADKHAIQVTSESNTSWSLFTGSDGDMIDGAKSIPISRLRWRDHGSSDLWRSFQTTPDAIFSSEPPTAGTTTRHDYELTIDWDDDPGSYSSILTYTLQGY